MKLQVQSKARQRSPIGANNSGQLLLGIVLAIVVASGKCETQTKGLVGGILYSPRLPRPSSASSPTAHLRSYSICGNYSQFNPEGYIVSPEITFGEHKDVNCTLEIKGDPSEMITIHFDDFAIDGASPDGSDLEQDPPRVTVCGSLGSPGSVPPCCLGAMLKIVELVPSKGRFRDAPRGHPISLAEVGQVQQKSYCGRGSSTPQPFLSAGNGVSLQFISVDALVPRTRNVTRSFRLRYLVSKFGAACADREFQCVTDRKCIPDSWRCNQLRECEDGSDERACGLPSPHPRPRGPLDARPRPGGQMSPALGGGASSRPRGEILGSPYPVLGMGLGNVGSGDYRSKHICGDHDHVPCGMHSKECFSMKQRCNGISDCPNGFDEVQCPHKISPTLVAYTLCQDFKGNATRCSPNSLYCYNREKHICNGIMECPRGEDERGCDSSCPELIRCGVSSYPPTGEDRCGFHEEERCDGRDDCRDGFDEMNCQQSSCGRRHGSFLCSDGRCIAWERRCDHALDCEGAEDEKDCIKNSVITAAILGSLVCGILVVVAISCTCRLYALRLVSYQRQQNCASAAPAGALPGSGPPGEPGDRFHRRSSISDSDLLRFDALQDLYCYYGFRDPPPPYSVAVAGDPPALPPPPPGASGRRRRSRTHHSRVYGRRSSSTAGGGADPASPGATADGPNSAESPPPPTVVVVPLPLQASSLPLAESPKQGTSYQQHPPQEQQQHHHQHHHPPYHQATSTTSDSSDMRRVSGTSIPRQTTPLEPSECSPLTAVTQTSAAICDERLRESTQRDAREHLNSTVDSNGSVDSNGCSAGSSTTEIEFSVLPPRSATSASSEAFVPVMATGVDASSARDDQPLIDE